MKDKDFNFNKEIICNYEVSENMKKVWHEEILILKRIISICEKYHIKYYMIAGSLLGTVRHNGMIPWDDDIDIAMLRKDYDKFLSVAQKELPSNLFLQYFKTEVGYFYGHAQVRNVNTTAIIKLDKYNNFNHGIFVDIFPIDNIPDNKFLKWVFLKKISLKKKMLFNYWNCSSNNFIKKKLKGGFFKIYWGIHKIEKETEKFENYVKKYDDLNTKECGMISFMQNRFIYKNEWFNSSKKHSFENFEVVIPTKYDEILTSSYGTDYMKIPEMKNGSVHGGVFFDTEKSYIEYIDKIDGITNNL